MALRPIPDEEARDESIGTLLQTLYAPETEPTTNQLLDYALGISPPAEARLIEQQLVTSALIRQELAELQALTGEFVQREAASTETPVAIQFLAWLRAQWPGLPLVAQAQNSPLAAPALRGTDSDYQIYTAGPYRLAFTITKGEAIEGERGREDFLIQGQLLDQEAPDAVCRGNVQLVTVPGSETDPTHTTPEIVAASDLDDFGYFSLSIAMPGHYRLVAALPAHTIWIQEIRLS